jgi:hypothetical protein
MDLFKSQLFQEAPRHVAGPYRQSFARCYGRRSERRYVAAKSGASATREDVAMQKADRELLQLSDYDIAA